jgi:peptidoglycan/xylan/chitin deacetylase (PgdA/CDA1 family)
MFYHKHTFKTAPWTEYHEVIACDQYLANLLGHPVHYRPPYGKITLVTMLRLMSAGRRIDWWSVATNDTGQLLTDPETLAKNIIAQKLPVVLMHSHHKDPKRREFVLQLTRQLVEKARQNNVRLVTMTELTICVDQLHKQK